MDIAQKSFSGKFTSDAKTLRTGMAALSLHDILITCNFLNADL